MAQEKGAPEQDPSEGSRETVERELQRAARSDKGRSSTRKGNTEDSREGERIAVETPLEPGDQNAQTIPSSM